MKKLFWIVFIGLFIASSLAFAQTKQVPLTSAVVNETSKTITGKNQFTSAIRIFHSFIWGIEPATFSGTVILQARRPGQDDTKWITLSGSCTSLSASDACVIYDALDLEYRVGISSSGTYSTGSIPVFIRYRTSPLAN
jgi:hypothetical protein